MATAEKKPTNGRRKKQEKTATLVTTEKRDDGWYMVSLAVDGTEVAADGPHSNRGAAHKLARQTGLERV